MALTRTPNNNHTSLAANSYGVMTASNAISRAKHPLIRPASTPKMIQQRSALVTARGATKTHRPHFQLPKTRLPRDGPSVVVTHGSAAAPTCRRLAFDQPGFLLDLLWQSLQHLRPILLFHLPLQLYESRRRGTQYRRRRPCGWQVRLRASSYAHGIAVR